MTALRSIFIIGAGALVLASCATAEREDNSDRASDELAQIAQLPQSRVCGGGRWSCKAHVRTDEQSRIKPFATPSGLGPADLASAYKLDPSKTSTGTIAIVDAFAYPNAASDLATYRSQFGLPPCTVANGCFKVVNTQNAGPAPAGDDWTVEAALDLDMASAACPTCKLTLVIAKDDQSNDLFNQQNTAASQPGVVAVSDSWGGPSDGSEATLEANFNHAGVAIFTSSGDSGNTGAAGDYPSTSAFVNAVGGTSLVKSTTASRGWTEGAWSGAGSTCSTVIAKPSWQTQTVCAKRAASDISAVADPNTGVAVFNAGSGGWIVVGGTSASSPFVAGVYTRYGLTGQSPAYAWTHASQYFDVTTGTNGSCGTKLCNAGAGWDGPTGIGTPNGAVLGGTTTCTPSCSGKTCGDDGCGGSCGTCGAGQTCSPAGTCTGGGGCAHPICSTGGKLTSTCDPCAQQICAADSFCCNSSWDSVCVGEVATVCNQSCGGGGGGSTCAHSECTTGPKLTTGCDSCATQICATDSFCCSSSWDSICVGEVASICGEVCN